MGLAAVSFSAGWRESAAARMRPLAEGATISGNVTFTETKKGLLVRAQLTGVPPGLHGLHIHEFGSCEDLGRAAGGHYNPTNAPHGEWSKGRPRKAHAGDLGNVSADADGKAYLEVTLAGVGLGWSKWFVAGRSVILQEKPDDFSQPAGNSGGRLACGVITLKVL